MPQRRLPSRTGSAFAALAVVLASAACRTTAPARPTADAPRCAPPQVTYVAVAPSVVIAADLAFVVLYAGIVPGPQGTPSFQISYLASMDGGDALLPDAPRRAAALASVLLAAYGPLLPATVTETDVTAVFGAPGTWGLAVPAHLARSAGAWGVAQPGDAARVAVPPIASPIARPAQGERAAVAAAGEFLERADARDTDGAWELASAAVRGVVTRQTFEEVIWPAAWHAAKLPRRELFRQYDVHPGDFRVGDLLTVSFASGGDVETVRVRLDDDQEWRVADLARGAAVAPLQDPPASAVPTSLSHGGGPAGRHDR